jgi:hypothetical protein
VSDSPLVGMNRDALHDQLELARLKITQRERTLWQHRAQHRRFSVMPQQGRGLGAITNL